MANEFRAEVRNNKDLATVRPFGCTVEVAVGKIPETGYAEHKASLTPFSARHLAHQLRISAAIVSARETVRDLALLPESIKEELRAALSQDAAFD